MSNTIRLWGTAQSKGAYEVRDFLQRSVVAFEWIEVSDSEQARQAGVESVTDPRLPVAQFGEGERIEKATVRAVAKHLGFVTKPRHSEYDLSIYGAGPAGLSAALYAASEGLRTVLIERGAVGGQAGSSSLRETQLGGPDGLSGAELAERARRQAVRFGAEIVQLREGVKAEFAEGGGIIVDLASGDTLSAKANICATGVEWRRLGLEREAEFLGRGVYYGAGVSEAPYCKGETVYVVGGGNSAGQAAVYLSEYADEVVMLVRGDSLATTMSSYLTEKLDGLANLRVRTGVEVKGLDGESQLEELTLEDQSADAPESLPAGRLFVCIGGVPNTDWAKDTDIVRDRNGFLVTGRALLDERAELPSCWSIDREPFFLETSVPGSFAAGDVRAGSIKRVASAVGEGGMAVAFVHRYLAERA